MMDTTPNAFRGGWHCKRVTLISYKLKAFSLRMINRNVMIQQLQIAQSDLKLCGAKTFCDN